MKTRGLTYLWIISLLLMPARAAFAAVSSPIDNAIGFVKQQVEAAATIQEEAITHATGFANAKMGKIGDPKKMAKIKKKAEKAKKKAEKLKKKAEKLKKLAEKAKKYQEKAKKLKAKADKLKAKAQKAMAKAQEYKQKAEKGINKAKDMYNEGKQKYEEGKELYNQGRELYSQANEMKDSLSGAAGGALDAARSKVSAARDKVSSATGGVLGGSGGTPAVTPAAGDYSAAAAASPVLPANNASPVVSSSEVSALPAVSTAQPVSAPTVVMPDTASVRRTFAPAVSSAGMTAIPAAAIDARVKALPLPVSAAQVTPLPTTGHTADAVAALTEETLSQEVKLPDGALPTLPAAEISVNDIAAKARDLAADPQTAEPLPAPRGAAPDLKTQLLRADQSSAVSKNKDSAPVKLHQSRQVKPVSRRRPIRLNKALRSDSTREELPHD